ncbi:SpoIIE family protein phosphatase [Cellulomonas endophytica]|uniref:SpoIIE family protein phosphatase n=1 Tax=Cellulomonas endophytica TaxID=2494735 RepID=UPI001011EEF2|nr:SpoIIE family protein phosphatase [Cellulomonas endophytica]
MSDPLLLRALRTSGVAVALSDPHQRDEPVVWVNDAFVALTGYAPEEVVGRNCRFLQGEGTDRAAARRLALAESGTRTVTETLLNHRKDGTPFWNQMVISPVLDEAGAMTHRIAVQADVTGRVRAERDRDDRLALAQATTVRLELLARVTDSVAAHLDYDDAVAALADAVVPALATWGFVVMTDEVGRVERLHVAVADPHRRPAADALEHDTVGWLTRSPSVNAALTGKDPLVSTPFDVDTAGLVHRTTPEQLEHLRALGLGSALVVPLRARGRVLGALCLVHERRGAFGSDTVVTAAHLGRRAGLALDNVRLYLRERRSALTLQHSLLPEIPDVPGLDLAATYLPSGLRAEVGGDWFDVLPLKSGRVGVAVGDVMGHDMQAAAAMGQLRSMLRTTAWREAPPAAALADVDELVRALDIGAVATAVYLTWAQDGSGAALAYASAGHPPVLVRRPSGAVERLEGSRTRPLGLGPLRADAESSVRLEPGAVLVAYTDGLVERRDRPLADGIRELERALAEAPAEAGSAAVRDHLVDRLVAERPEDDMCLLVMRHL